MEQHKRQGLLCIGGNGYVYYFFNVFSGSCPRELLKGPLYYASTITLVTVVFWRTSPIGPVTISNLCAGDGKNHLVCNFYSPFSCLRIGAEAVISQSIESLFSAGFADIVGRRLGTVKLPYNKNKSLAGSFTMLLMGFTFSVGYVLL
jgi:farnesol kinase